MLICARRPAAAPQPTSPAGPSDKGPPRDTALVRRRGKNAPASTALRALTLRRRSVGVCVCVCVCTTAFAAKPPVLLVCRFGAVVGTALTVCLPTLLRKGHGRIEGLTSPLLRPHWPDGITTEYRTFYNIYYIFYSI